MALTLPHNILSYIGTFIDHDDRRHCALVCKHWTEPFLDAYWGRLKIGNYITNMDRMLSNKAYLINAHRVWAVEFYRICLHSYEILLEFQRSFPGIRYLKLYDFRSHAFSILDELDWNLWQSLTHLHIGFSNKSKTSFWQSLFTNLSVLPCLVHLTLDQEHHLAKQSPISWNNFESLHYHLPRLEYLEHNFPFKPITRDEIENIKAVEPAQTMTKIDFDNDDFDTLWLFYFASKYPNLQHFILYRYLSSNDYPIDCNPQDYQSDLQLLSTLDQFFPCLKRAATVLRNKSIYLPFIFYETLRHFGTKIENVRLRYDSPIENDNISRYIQPISESLKILYIHLFTSETIHFAVFPRLVTLCIYGQATLSITADEILEYFSALRSLSVDGINLSLSTNPHTYTPHPLQKLEIKDSDITNDALHYLFLRCNQLKHVTLTDIRNNIINTSYQHKYEDKYNNIPGQLIFDMSMTNLDTFIFAFTAGLLRERQTFPKHYVIEQMENDNDVL